jgi:hypothetical protein
LHQGESLENQIASYRRLIGYDNDANGKLIVKIEERDELQERLAALQ